MKERLLVGLDVGTSCVRLVAGQLGVTPDRRPSLNIIGAVETPSAGIAKGAISSLEDAVASISACLEQAERVIGAPIREAAVGVGGAFISAQNSRGVIGVSRTDGDIRGEDVQRAIEAAKAVINPANQEIIHVLPRGFSVDGQQGIKDPVGMQGIRLEVDALLVQGLSSHIKNLTKAVFRTGLDITELVYAPLALGEAVTTSKQREVGVCVLGIGASTTGVAVYENGELLHAATIPIGADHITSDLAIGLRVSLDVAEQLKRAHGQAVAETVPKRAPEIELDPFGAPGETAAPRFMAEIVEARAEELFEKVDQELKKIDREGLLPSGILLAGGGSKLPGMVDVAKRVLRLPCAIAQSNPVPTSMPEALQDPAFATAVGLVLWSFEAERRAEERGSHGGSAARTGEWASKAAAPFKKLFKSFLP